MDTIAALRIDTDGTISEVELEDVDGTVLQSMYRHMDCELVELVELTSSLNMWLDEEGLYRQPVNQVATALARMYGLTWQPYHGHVVITGGADRHGRTLPLSPQARQVALDVLLTVAS